MQRILWAAAVLIATLASSPGQALPREAPWCAVTSMGRGSVYWDCQYASIEACRPNVIAGNRGFCNPNPRYEGAKVAPKARKKRYSSHR